MGELRDRLDVLAGKMQTFAKVIELPRRQSEITRLESRMAEGDFWTDQQRAQVQVAELKSSKQIVEPCLELSKRVQDAIELLEMAEAENDAGTIADIDREAGTIAADYEKAELALALNGKYDRCNIYLTIKPGAGGTESCDWAEMLFRMYTAYCAIAGYQCEVLDMLPAEEAGLKACTLGIRGPNAYGLFKAEMGTHRLVRISPFDNANRRQTSFSAVEITPELEDVGEVTLDEKELRVDTYRASGAGGQHVNKTDSAVRITHVPTGMFVACQAERSQVQNKATAMKMLCAKLQQLKESERLDELKGLGGERGTIAWGYQIRSYVMMPYQMVKDLRTGHETSQIQGVLDGAIQPFIDAYLRWVIAGRPDRKAGAKEE